MLRCNLAVLLSERNLRITKVSNDTGISRTTLTALANNYGQGIQFDTINTLCTYLDITPEQLFLFSPYDVKADVKFFSLNLKDAIDSTDCEKYVDVPFDTNVTVRNKKSILSMTMPSFASIKKNVYGFINDADIYLSFYDVDEEDEEQIYEKQNLIKYLGGLHISFLKDIEESLCADIVSECNYENEKVKETYGSEEQFHLKYGEYIEDVSSVSYHLYWPSEIMHKSKVR